MRFSHGETHFHTFWPLRETCSLNERVIGVANYVFARKTICSISESHFGMVKAFSFCKRVLAFSNQVFGR